MGERKKTTKKNLTNGGAPKGIESSAIFKDVVAFAQQDSRVLAIVVFGSYARNEPNRDIDICIFANKNTDPYEILLTYLEKFENQFDKKMDFSIFSQVPLYIRSRILKEGIILLDKDYDSLFQLYLDTIREYELFEPHYKTFLEAVRNG